MVRAVERFSIESQNQNQINNNDQSEEEKMFLWSISFLLKRFYKKRGKTRATKS